MEQSPSSNTKYRFPRRGIAILATLGLSGFLLQPDTPQRLDSAIARIEEYATETNQTGQQLAGMAGADLDIFGRAETHNDRYGVREQLLPHGTLANDAFFEDTTQWDISAF